jgi:hypothetical protein
MVGDIAGILNGLLENLLEVVEKKGAGRSEIVVRGDIITMRTRIPTGIRL